MDCMRGNTISSDDFTAATAKIGYEADSGQAALIGESTNQVGGTREIPVEFSRPFRRFFKQQGVQITGREPLNIHQFGTSGKGIGNGGHRNLSIYVREESAETYV